MGRRQSDGAATHLDTPVLFFAASIAAPEPAAAAEAETTSFEAAPRPYAADRTYPRLRGARHEPEPYPGHRDARPAA